MMPAIAPEITRTPTETQTFIREQVVPKRRAIIQISNQIRTLNIYAVQSFAQRTAIHTELTHDPLPIRMSPDLEICAYRIIQEALTNVAKHAGATSCRVSLTRLPFSLFISARTMARAATSG
jgi:glucose-6-phosphate-specific signal transduction histidine kinase